MLESQNKENQGIPQDEANTLANSMNSQIKKSDPSDEELDDEESGDDFNLMDSSYSVKSEVMIKRQFLLRISRSGFAG